MLLSVAVIEAVTGGHKRNLDIKILAELVKKADCFFTDRGEILFGKVNRKVTRKRERGEKNVDNKDKCDKNKGKCDRKSAVFIASVISDSGIFVFLSQCFIPPFLGPTALFDNARSEEYRYCRKREVINYRRNVERLVCKGNETVDYREPFKNGAPEGRFDISGEKADEKHCHVNAHCRDSGDKLVFGERREKHADRDKRRAEKEDAEDVYHDRCEVGRAVFEEQQEIEAVNDEGRAEYGDCRKIFTHYDTEYRNGAGEQDLIGTGSSVLCEELHGEKRQKNCEHRHKINEIVADVARSLRIKRGGGEDKSRYYKEHTAEDISDRSVKIRFKFS